MEKQRFVIDFFEFSFLVEACIPPVPIARSVFWENVIDVYYHELTESERSRLFEWINFNWSFKSGLKDKNEGCLLFYNRFNPDNQYEVTTEFNGKVEKIRCFKHKGINDEENYYTSKNRYIAKEYIMKEEKI